MALTRDPTWDSPNLGQPQTGTAPTWEGRKGDGAMTADFWALGDWV